MTARHSYLFIVDVDDVQESAAVFERRQADAVLKDDVDGRVPAPDGVVLRQTPTIIHLVEL